MDVDHQRNAVFKENVLARNLEPKCKQCRREGEKLFLKGAKCFTEKCAIERRNYPPGQHGQKKEDYLIMVGSFVKNKKLEEFMEY